MNWELLDKFNAILGIFGFIISTFTFWFSLRVHKRVDEIIDRVNYREDFKKHIGISESFLDTLKSNKIDTSKLQLDMSDFIADVSSKYSFLPRKISKRLKILSKFNYSNIDKDINQQQKFRKQIIELKNHLEKESKK